MKDKALDDDDLLRVDALSDDFPTYGVQDNTITAEEVNKSQYSEDIAKDKNPNGKTKGEEELNVNPTPRYNSFEQIKKELVILDLERKIAWEELISVKHDLKEDLSPSNFVEPALKTVGIVGGLVLLKNLIFGK